MTQLLQARGWYGVFLHAEPMQPKPDGENGAKECARLHVQLRPLIGWTSVEGGFSGLYYNEMYGKLSTATKITIDAPGFHVGDICQSEDTTIRALLIKNVLDQGHRRYVQYLHEFEVELTEEAISLLVMKKIPLPGPYRIDEE